MGGGIVPARTGTHRCDSILGNPRISHISRIRPPFLRETLAKKFANSLEIEGHLTTSKYFINLAAKLVFEMIYH